MTFKVIVSGRKVMSSVCVSFAEGGGIKCRPNPAVTFLFVLFHGSDRRMDRRTLRDGIGRASSACIASRDCAAKTLKMGK